MSEFDLPETSIRHTRVIPGDISANAANPLDAGRNFNLRDVKRAVIHTTAAGGIAAMGILSCTPTNTPTSTPTHESSTSTPKPIETTSSPIPAVEAQRLNPDVNLIKSLIKEYPWNAKAGEGIIETPSGISVWAKFQKFGKNELFVTIDSQVLLIEVGADTPLYQRPKDFTPGKPLSEQIRPTEADQFKPGDTVELPFKKTPEGDKLSLGNISRIEG